jgi:diguanylate cyclase (GGDEF)-like protein
MRVPNKLLQVVNRLNIASKISISFGLLLAIILVELGVSFVALNLILDSTSSIQVNTEIVRVVLNMSRNWESAQRLQKTYFYESASISSEQSYKLYALPASVKIDEIIRDGARLKQINRSYLEKSPLFDKESELNLILAEISQYATTLQDATDLELQLYSANGGLDQDLESKAQSLLQQLQITNQSPDMLSIFYRIRFFDEQYMISHGESSSVASAANLESLHREITEQISDPYIRTRVLTALDNYKTNRDKIIFTDANIQGKTVSLDSLSSTIEPRMIELMTAVNGNMIRNRSLIEQTRFITGLILIIVMAVAFLFTIIIAFGLNSTITLKIIKLNQVANQFQNGDLDARAQVDSSDELGQLASSFNNMAFQLRQTIDRTRRQAEHDHLTGLYNRMGFWEASQREINRCLRFNRPISLIFMDIDQFKKFNDQYSYEVGDRVLKHLSQCLLDDLRNFDLIGRYGGEEFVILLPETDLPHATEVAERLREYIEMRPMKTDSGSLTVTVSIGIGVYYPDLLNSSGHTEEQILNKLIDQGGEMVHVAKAEGRNRVSVPIL